MDTAFTVFSSSDCAHVRRVCTVCARACGKRARRQPVMEAACRAMQRDHDEDPDEDRQREVSVRRPPDGWDGHPNRPIGRVGDFVRRYLAETRAKRPTARSIVSS